MKKFIMMAVMAVAALTASARKQDVKTFSIMPRIGVGMSIFSDCHVGYATLLNSKYVLVSEEKVSNNMCFALGAEATYQVAPLFAVSAGLDFDEYMSVERKIQNNDVTVRFGYLDIPILAHLTLGNCFALGAGVQPGFKVYASCGEENLGGNVNSFAFSIPVEAACTFGKCVVGVRYNIPITKAYKYEGQNPKVSGVMLTFGYRFDL